MKEWAEDSTEGCEGFFDEDEGPSPGQRMMSGEQGLELSGAGRNGAALFVLPTANQLCCAKSGEAGRK